MVPFLAVYSPMLMLTGEFTMPELIEALITAIVGVIALSAALEDWFLRRCYLWERVVLFVSSLLLMIPGLITDIIGGIGVVLVFFVQKRSINKSQS